MFGRLALQAVFPETKTDWSGQNAPSANGCTLQVHRSMREIRMVYTSAVTCIVRVAVSGNCLTPWHSVVIYRLSLETSGSCIAKLNVLRHLRYHV